MEGGWAWAVTGAPAVDGVSTSDLPLTLATASLNVSVIVPVSEKSFVPSAGAIEDSSGAAVSLTTKMLMQGT